jgi:copper chaperone CopZ
MSDSHDPVVQEYHVTGMTCGHCVQAVTDELTGISGVTAVTVDLESGRVVVVSAAALDPVVVASAVDEAGYELAQ